MIKKLTQLIFLLLIPGLLFAQTGKVTGKIIDRESKEPLIGANIVIVSTQLGAVSDIDGKYTVLSVTPGGYTIKASYIGYQSISVTNVRVSAGLTTELNFDLPSQAVQVPTVEIVAERPLINKDYTNTLRVQTGEEINNLPIRGVANVVGLQASVVKDEASNLLYIRGGRPEEVGYVLDGVPVNNPLNGMAGNTFTNVNQNSIEEMQIQTGGFNAEYGSAMSGLVSLNTKQGSSRYTGSAEFITDAFMNRTRDDNNNGWGYYESNVTLGGPIMQGSDLATLFLSGQRLIMVDNDPRAVGGSKLNSKTKSWTFNGKLDVQPTKLVDLKIGGTYYSNSGQNWSNYYRFFDANHQTHFDNSNFSGFARLTHTLQTNMFYTLQFSYFDERLKSGDGVWFDDILSYGDPVKNPLLPFTAKQPTELYSIVAAPGTINDLFNKSKSQIFTLSGDVNLQEGNHLFKFGGEYRMYKIRRYNVNPMGLADTLTGAVNGWLGYRSQNAQYYGYSYDGQSEYDGSDDYFNSDTSAGRKEGPKKPLYFALYLQDKIELSDLVLNLGVRLDHFDAKERVPIDQANPFNFDGKDRSNAFEAKDLRDSRALTAVSPRLGFSFPITDKAIFHAQYGTFLQFPPLNYILISKTWEDRMIGDGPFSARIPNPDLAPERTVSYEFGFKQTIGENAALSITGFYKEIKDLIQARSVTASPNNYETYENVDFGTVKGFDFIFELRRTKNLAVTLNYTLGFANGTGSDPQTQSRISWIQTENPKIIAPLSFDRRHVGSINLDYRLLAGQGPKFGDIFPLEKTDMNLLFSFNSGIPYTKSVITNPFFGGVTEIRPIGPINGAETPWNFRFDLRLERGFSAGPLNCITSLSVINLFDFKNVVSVYVPRRGAAVLENETGVYIGTGEPDNSGWLSTADGQVYAQKYGPQAVALFKTREKNPENFGVPRQIRFGVRVEY
jgi:outer membrane receptor protein involved in Fe transport